MTELELYEALCGLTPTWEEIDREWDHIFEQIEQRLYLFAWGVRHEIILTNN